MVFIYIKTTIITKCYSINWFSYFWCFVHNFCRFSIPINYCITYLYSLPIVPQPCDRDTGRAVQTFQGDQQGVARRAAQTLPRQHRRIPQARRGHLHHADGTARRTEGRTEKPDGAQPAHHDRDHEPDERTERQFESAGRLGRNAAGNDPGQFGAHQRGITTKRNTNIKDAEDTTCAPTSCCTCPGKTSSSTRRFRSRLS